MKIKIKTELIEINIEDESSFDKEGFPSRKIPPINECLQNAINEAIRLHSEVYEHYN